MPKQYKTLLVFISFIKEQQKIFLFLTAVFITKTAYSKQYKITTVTMTTRFWDTHTHTLILVGGVSREGKAYSFRDEGKTAGRRQLRKRKSPCSNELGIPFSLVTSFWSRHYEKIQHILATIQETGQGEERPSSEIHQLYTLLFIFHFDKRHNVFRECVCACSRAGADAPYGINVVYATYTAAEYTSINI